MSYDLFRARYPAFNRVFHFTERANIASIKQRGLLSLREIGTQNLAEGIKFCSSPESRKVDTREGLDHYVRLCFISDHPMVYRAQERSQMKDPVYVNLNAAILDLPGIRVAAGIAYQAGIRAYTLAEAIEVLDFDVLFTRTDWNDPEINRRRQAARKYEILVPERIDPKYIIWP